MSGKNGNGQKIKESADANIGVKTIHSSTVAAFAEMFYQLSVMVAKCNEAKGDVAPLNTALKSLGRLTYAIPRNHHDKLANADHTTLHELILDIREFRNTDNWRAKPTLESELQSAICDILPNDPSAIRMDATEFKIQVAILIRELEKHVTDGMKDDMHALQLFVDTVCIRYEKYNPVKPGMSVSCALHLSGQDLQGLSPRDLLDAISVVETAIMRKICIMESMLGIQYITSPDNSELKRTIQGFYPAQALFQQAISKALTGRAPPVYFDAAVDVTLAPITEAAEKYKDLVAGPEFSEMTSQLKLLYRAFYARVRTQFDEGPAFPNNLCGDA